MRWEAVLEAADVLLTPAAPHEVVVELPSGAAGRLRLVRSARTLHASQMLRSSRSARPAQAASAVSGARGDGEAPRLWVAPSAAPSALDLARTSGDSVVSSTGQLLLQVGGEVLELAELAASTTRLPAPRRGRAPWGAVGVARRLLEVDADRQEDLALLCGVSQERVSRILSRLRADGLVTRDPVGAVAVGAVGRPVGRPVDRPTSAPALLDWLVRHYPRDQELRGHYFAPDPPRTQLARAVRALDGRRPLLSGDLAADQLAPWRRPAHVHLYCANPVDLTGAGFVSAPAGQATLTVVASPDPTLAVPPVGATAWASASVADNQTPSGATAMVELADPVQVLLDLLDSTAPDAPDAADRLRAQLLDGSLRTTISGWLTDVIRTTGIGRAADRASNE